METPGDGEGVTQAWLQDELKKLLFETNPLAREERIHELAKLCKHLPGVGIKAIKATLKALDNAAKAAAHAKATEAAGPIVGGFNERYFVWRNGSKVRVGELVNRQLNGHQFATISAYTRDDFRLATANIAAPDGTLVADLWLASDDRREATGTTLDPTQPPLSITPLGLLNLWQGFGVKPKAGSYGWFTLHLLKLFDGDKEVVQYVLNWLALAVQRPTLPIGTAIIMVGPPGAGKGMLGNTMRSIFGPHGITIEDREGLVGKFNSHLRLACFAFVDEPPFAGSKADADRLKHLITEPIIRVEQKFLDSEEVDNRLKILAATNHQWAAHIEPGDRRFCVVQCSEKLLGDVAYFKSLAAKAADPAAKAAVLHLLLTLDISHFNAERDRPKTLLYAQQKAASLSGDWLFWRQVTELENFNIGRGAKDNFPVPEPHHGWIPKGQIYHRYAAWHETSGGRGAPVVPELFWRNFRKWAGSINTRRDQYGSGERLIKVELPHLQTLGKRLNRHLGDTRDENEEKSEN